MATTIKHAVIESNITVTQTLGGNNQSGNPVAALNDTKKYDSSTTPDGEYVYTADLTLTGGTDTIDLYDGLTDAEGNTISNNGKKVRSYKFRSKTGNSGAINIKNGASNSYPLGGTTYDWDLLAAGDFLHGQIADSTAISSSVFQIDYSGTVGDVLEVIIIFG